MSTELGSHRLRILLVEDNADDAALLERHLRKSGFEPKLIRVETATDMAAALESGEPIDIVLADYNLPTFSGPEALRMLKTSDLDIPFIMLSGAVSEQTAVESMRAGAQDYVSKQNLTRLIPAVERELKEALGRRDKRDAQVALRASEARFRGLVDALPMGLFLNDVEGRVLYANNAIAQLLQWSISELTSGEVRVETLCPDIAKAQSSRNEGGGSTTPFEAVCRTKDGREIDALIGVAILNSQATIGQQQFATFVADLSLQKKSEEALRQTEKLAVAARLSASIAHEINNPLEAVTNCLYLASTAAALTDAHDYVNMAQQELNRVSQITVQTLRFFRGSVKKEAVRLDELIETVLTLLESRLRASGIDVVRQFRTPSSILVQAGEVRQVIANLLSNAMDAMAAGGRLVLRTAKSYDWQTGESGVVLTVADTGMGMNEETQTRLFEPFYSTKGITGTGLGLWISQDIVTKHNGTLRVRSKPHAGTVFRLFIPSAGSPDIRSEANRD